MTPNKHTSALMCDIWPILCLHFRKFDMDSLLNVNITLDFPLCEGIKPPKHIYLVMNPIIHVLCRVHLINHLASYFIFSILYVSSENHRCPPSNSKIYKVYPLLYTLEGKSYSVDLFFRITWGTPMVFKIWLQFIIIMTTFFFEVSVNFYLHK